MKTRKLVCGVDVSKDTLDLYFNDDLGKEHYLRVGNDQKGRASVLDRLGTDRTYVMESTGPYYLWFAFILCQHGAVVRVENPITIKRFIQMHLERNKSDRKDARWLYFYGIDQEGIPWQLPCQESLKCNQIMALMDMYIRQMTQLSNQLHSLQQLPIVDKALLKSIASMRTKLSRELKNLEARLNDLLNSWQGEQVKRLRSIPGLGKRAVALLITYTNGFKKIQNHRQLIALAGLAPREFSSGTSVRGRKGICKMGNGHLRNVLYMCSLSAIKHNTACKELYERLKAQGKRSKVALIAVCNKLLKQAFAIATKETFYQHDYKSSLI
jgi:transposase